MNALMLSVATLALAAPPAPMPGEPMPGMSPLVYLRLVVPPGARTTFHPGTPGAKTLGAGSEVGVRPGYVYRVELANLPGIPGALYPSLEVRGILQTSVLQASRHPVPLVFTPEEVLRVWRTGSMITKVYYLEDPAQAAPIQTTANEPLVFEVPHDTDPIQEARQRGRPMIIVRLGEREATREELARTAVPNTILFPGEKRLATPPLPPSISWLHLPIYDPLIGPRSGHEECLPDGGDIGPRIGIGPGGKLGGLNASDAAIEYSTEAGKKRVAVSNRVCVLVPRYAIARQEVAPAGIDTKVAVGNAIGSKVNIELRNQTPPHNTETVTVLAGAQSRLTPSGMHNRVIVNGYESLKGVRIVATVGGTKVNGAVKEPEEITAFPFCEPISLFKWANPKEAQIGDLVTFYLRYYNHTKEAVENLVVSDSLSARLEYVPGSARSDREAVLTTQPNEAGSMILRWEIGGKLAPGQSGVVTFQARVR